MNVLLTILTVIYVAKGILSGFESKWDEGTFFIAMAIFLYLQVARTT